MVKETQGTIYACEKCGKRALYRSDLETHEKNCGIGVKVKVGDLVLVSRGYGAIETAEVANISGKKLIVQYKVGGQKSEQEQSESVRAYDEATVAEIKRLHIESAEFQAKANDRMKQALALFRSLPSAWG